MTAVFRFVPSSSSPTKIVTLALGSPLAAPWFADRFAATPDRLETRRRHDHVVPVGPVTSVRAPVGATKLDHAVVRAQARDALVGLGWKPGIARAAVDEACADLGVGAEIQVAIREALRRCPKPKG